VGREADPGSDSPPVGGRWFVSVYVELPEMVRCARVCGERLPRFRETPPFVPRRTPLVGVGGGAAAELADRRLEFDGAAHRDHLQ
jgi:hypothetical protein